jgi:hypothetical protein
LPIPTLSSKLAQASPSRKSSSARARQLSGGWKQTRSTRPLATDHLVLALGGGALESPATREFLFTLENSRVVFLEAPLDTLIDRCASQPNAPVRPVLRDRERLAERWQARLPLYRQAHLTVATAGRTPEAVVDCILTELHRLEEERLCAAGHRRSARPAAGGRA